MVLAQTHVWINEKRKVGDFVQCLIRECSASYPTLTRSPSTVVDQKKGLLYASFLLLLLCGMEH